MKIQKRKLIIKRTFFHKLTYLLSLAVPILSFVIPGFVGPKYWEFVRTTWVYVMTLLVLSATLILLDANYTKQKFNNESYKEMMNNLEKPKGQWD